MPRRTPVRELQQEESVASSPLRRSSRLNANSPVPTKVIGRRNSSSDSSTSTPIVTRSRRSSFNQESKPSEEQQIDKKKPVSTIKTRRSSLTQNKDDQSQVQPLAKSKNRSTSVEPEQTPEVKKPIGRRRSITEDSESDQVVSKKITRSRSNSASKKNEISETKSTQNESSASVEVSASTPLKKSPSSEETSDILDSIEETEKEVDSPSATPSKKLRRRTEVVKMDLDLSVINEASLTDEETSPRKNSTIVQDENQSKITDSENCTPGIRSDENAAGLVDLNQANKESSKNDPELESSSPTKNIAAGKPDSSVSDSSFSLQLSPLENDIKKVDANNKENISPKESKCEPMEVDEVFTELSPLKTKHMKSPQVIVTRLEIEAEKKLHHANKLAKIASDEVQVDSNKKDGLELATLSNDAAGLDKTQTDEKIDGLNDSENEEAAPKEEKEKIREMLPAEEMYGEEVDVVSEDNTKEVNLRDVSNENEVNDSTVSKEVVEPSNPEAEITAQATESPATESTTQETSEKRKSINLELSDTVVDKKSPKKTPSKIKSDKRKSSPLREREEPVTVVDKLSEVPIPVEINSESALETEELSLSGKKKVVQKDAGEEMEKDANEKSMLEEDATIKKSFTDTHQTSLKEKENIAVPDQEESRVSLQLNQEEELVSVEISDSDEDLDLEVETINESKTENIEEKNSVKVCYSDTSEEYEGSEKKIKTCDSNDEINTSTKESSKNKSFDGLEKSFDSKQMNTGGGKSQIEKPHVSSSDFAELTDEEKNDENLDDKVFEDDSDNNASNLNETMNNEAVGNGDGDTKNKVVEEKKDSFNISTNSLKSRSLDRRSITLQETIKAGDDPEDELSSRIHKAVDLFCSNIKNKSDLSINVSMEYTEHITDSEDEHGAADVINVSLTACDVNEEAEPKRGSKRRKICHVSVNSDTKKNEDEFIPESSDKTSQDSSFTDSVEKPKKRKSNSLQAENVPKTPSKVSFSTDVEDHSKATKKGKNRKSLDDVSHKKESVVNSAKKPLPLTPYKVKKTNQKLEESSENVEESEEEEDSTDNESPTMEATEHTEDGDSHSSSEETLDEDDHNESITRNYGNILSVTFEETDVNDTTWTPSEDNQSDDSDSEIEDADAEKENTQSDDSSEDLDIGTEEESQQEDALPVATTKLRRKIISQISSEETDTKEKNQEALGSDSSSSVEDIPKKKQNSSKNKKRKLFSVSSNNLSQAFASSETDDNVIVEPAVSTKVSKKNSKDAVSDQNKRNKKHKKSKQTFSAETVERMLPQKSEVEEITKKKNRKRIYPSSISSADEKEVKITKKNKLVSKKTTKEVKKDIAIKPSAGKMKNVKPSGIKPSTKMNSGWDVSEYK